MESATCKPYQKATAFLFASSDSSPCRGGKSCRMGALFILTLIFGSPSPSLTLHADEGQSGINLFILSGQSNMAGMKPEESFTPAVEKAFGKANVAGGE